MNVPRFLPTPEAVRELRAETGEGMMTCRFRLEHTTVLHSIQNIRDGNAEDGELADVLLWLAYHARPG